MDNDLIKKIAKLESILDTVNNSEELIKFTKELENYKYEELEPERMVINFVNKSNNLDPEYKFEGDSGFDFRANIDSPIQLKQLERALIPTGLYFDIPAGFEMQVRPRSGLAHKNGIDIFFGTIDSPYKGEIKINIINLGKETFIINNGDRIAQGVFCAVLNKINMDLKKIDELTTKSDRADSGFGSTGVV